MKNKNVDIQKLTLLSILTALTVILGYFLKIPTATGMLTLLDAGIFFTALYLGKKEGAIVGGLAGFLIDLMSGYPQWMLASLVIHGAQGYLAGFSGKSRGLGLLLASLVMVAGYAVVSTYLYGLGAAMADIPHNIIQNLTGLAVGALHYLAFSRRQLVKE